jgi:hypothetical protein
MSNTITITIERDGHTFTMTYKGGRLADVAIDGTLVDCTEVGNFNWVVGAQVQPLSRADLLAELGEWIDESGTDHINELPYL